MGDEIGQFRGFAGIGKGQDRIAGHDHAEVAVRCLGGMHEHRGRAGGGERCGDLAGDMAGFAHACDDDPSRASSEPADGGVEFGIERGRQRIQPGRLRREHAACDFDVGGAEIGCG